MRRPRRRLKPAKTVAVGCHRWPRPQNGKEGVDGSSPSEGSVKCLQMGMYCCLPRRILDPSRVTKRVHFGTGGHSRARATSRDSASVVLETRGRDRRHGKTLQTGTRVARAGAKLSPSFAREGVDVFVARQRCSFLLQSGTGIGRIRTRCTPCG